MDLPGVDEMLLPASLFVTVEDQVTVSPKELTVGRGIHRDTVSSLHTPDLTQTNVSVNDRLIKEHCLELDLPFIHISSNINSSLSAKCK